MAQLGIQAAEALQYAHDHGIVHRDIKPGNLLLDQDGKLWITDFGLARIEGDANLTMTGDFLGTLRYMSPEQALGPSTSVDHRTDIYSLGATLYELLTGQPLVVGCDRGQILRQLADHQPLPPPKPASPIPLDLETIILKATANQPAHRYATANQLGDDLQRFLERQPITARRPSRRVGVSPAIQIATAALLAAATVAIAGYGSTPYSVLTTPSKHAQSPTTHPPDVTISSSPDPKSPIPNLKSEIQNLKSPSPIPPPPGLIAWWSGDGHTQDGVGGNHGTLEGGAAFGRGIVGQAFYLDGIDDYIRVPHDKSFDALRELTIECWIRCIDTNGPRVVAGKWSDPTKEWSFLFKIATEGDRLRLELNDESTQKNMVDLRGKSRLPIGEWAHVAATYDGNMARLYLNGGEENHQIVGPAKYVQRGQMDLVVGANDWGPSGFRECFRGLIDELCLYRRALSSEEVWSIYQAGSAGKIKPSHLIRSHRANDET